MAQCEKCGYSDRVVSKTTNYWGPGLGWTFGAIAWLGLCWTQGTGEDTSGNVLWGIGVVILIMAISKWIKAFNGKTFIQHTCKRCNNTWRTGDD